MAGTCRCYGSIFNSAFNKFYFFSTCCFFLPEWLYTCNNVTSNHATSFMVILITGINDKNVEYLMYTSALQYIYIVLVVFLSLEPGRMSFCVYGCTCYDSVVCPYCMVPSVAHIH